ncbi:PAS domain-containing protein [Paludibacterium denitrificans]|uniref:PAS domain S-box protein n=1 Tax=Paludibacterium denitrificans TaxID=2675226 RepID=A0A844GBQ1_9NEIS|nr:PAS domain S-box protein [Paludibacterium denitrificans]MTD32731.1 PAS domain S-box protein [Paludibacterium denitrificans]
MSLLLLRAARQQQFLAASEKRYRSFFQKNTSVKLVINPANGMIVDANPAAAAYYGYTREQLLGMGMANIDCLPVEALLAEMHAAQTEQRTYFNLRHRLTSGEERDVEVYAGPVEIEGKTLIFAIIHDVTTRHELERRLSASEELHRSLFLTIAEGVVVINGDGEITSWNSAALSILGVSADALQTRRSVLLDANGEALAPHDYPSRQAARGEHLTQCAVWRSQGRWLTHLAAVQQPSAAGRQPRLCRCRGLVVCRHHPIGGRGRIAAAGSVGVRGGWRRHHGYECRKPHHRGQSGL